MPRVHAVERKNEDGSWNRTEYSAPWWVPTFVFDNWMFLRMWHEGFSEGSKWKVDQSEMRLRREPKD